MRSNTTEKLIMIAMLGGISMPAGGHHSGSMYEYGKSVALDGVVTRVRWVNPHVYFEILPSNEEKRDDPWVVEAEPPALMSKFGWNRDSIRVGDNVTITAMPHVDPSRRMAFGVSAVTADGSHLWISGAIPYDEQSKEPDNPSIANSIAGVWVTLFDPEVVVPIIHREPSSSLTEEGNKALRQFDNELVLGSECIPDPAPYPMVLPISTAIEIGESKIQIRFESDRGLVERTVHMGLRSHFGANYSNQGHSIGWWEGETLVVDTDHFELHPEGNASGLPSSIDKHLVEEFRLSDDRTKLNYSFRVEDPMYLAKPAVAEMQLSYRPDLRVLNVPCDVESARKYLDE